MFTTYFSCQAADNYITAVSYTVGKFSQKRLWYKKKSDKYTNGTNLNYQSFSLNIKSSLQLPLSVHSRAVNLGTTAFHMLHNLLTVQKNSPRKDKKKPYAEGL